MWNCLATLRTRLCSPGVWLAGVIAISSPGALAFDGQSVGEYLSAGIGHVTAAKVEPPPALIEGKVRQGLLAVHARDAPVLDWASYLTDTIRIELFAIKIQAGLLTFHVRDAPLADVLHTIGYKLGFSVTIRGDLSIPVTGTFADVRLEQAITRLIGEHSWTMTYGLLEPDRQESGPSALHVYARRAKDTEPATVMQPTAKNSDLTDGPHSSQGKRRLND